LVERLAMVETDVRADCAPYRLRVEERQAPAAPFALCRF